MDKTYGVNITNFRIQLMNFTAHYLNGVAGMTDAAKGGVGLIIGNIIRRNQYTENDRKGMHEYAEKHGYSYQQISGIVEGALSAWLAHIENFKAQQ